LMAPNSYICNRKFACRQAYLRAGQT
jgi:hypothetical protein